MNIITAAVNGNLEKLNELIKDGADIDVKDFHNNTALMMAAFKGYAGCVDALIKAGADINAKDIDGWTALMSADNEGNKDCVALLEQAQRDLEAKKTNSVIQPVPNMVVDIAVIDDMSTDKELEELDKSAQVPEVKHSDFSKALTKTLEELGTMLLSKNASYGNAALEPLRIFSKADSVEQLKVRIDDKLSRLQRGSEIGEDTVKDLTGYLILFLMARGKNEN